MAVSTEDREILEQIAALFASLRADENWADNLSDRESQLMENGLEDLENGRVVSDDAVRQKVQNLFSANL